MKKVIFSFFIICLISSCSFVKDVQKHCRVSQTDYNLHTGSFTGCLTCDSLATVVKQGIQKAQSKQ